MKRVRLKAYLKQGGEDSWTWTECRERYTVRHARGCSAWASSLGLTVFRATVAVHDHGCSYQRHLDPIKSLYPRVASQQNGVE